MILTKKQIYFSLAINTIAFITYATINYVLHKGIIGPQQYKYPPTIYFISFSLTITWVIYIVLHSTKIENLNQIIKFVASNTIWIYLWHIPAVEFFKSSPVNYNFIIKYIVTILLATFITYLQILLVNKITKKRKGNLIRVIFTG